MTYGIFRASAPGARVRRRLVAAVLSAVLVAMPAPAVWAAGGGGGHSAQGDAGHGGAPGGTGGGLETTPPRTQAQNIGGRYMQLNVLWLPVMQGSRHRYQAVTARLVPHPAKRVMACFKAPWAQEALLFALNESPLTVEAIETWEPAESEGRRATARDDGLASAASRRTEAAAGRQQAEAFKQELLDRVHNYVGVRDLYVDILLVSGMPRPDGGEETLSKMCQ